MQPSEGAAGAERLIFVTRRPPFPLDNGARIRGHRLITGLSASFRTTLLTYAHHPLSSDGAVTAGELAEALPGVEIVLVPGLPAGKRGAQLSSMLSPASYEFGRYRVPAFEGQLRRLLAERRPTIVHLDDPGVASLLPLPDALSVFAPHNVEHRIIHGNARASRGIRRAFSELEWRKVRREEQRAWRAADLCVAVSALDAATLRAAGATSVAVCPNGTDRTRSLQPPRRTGNGPFRLLFVGSGAYRPYELGLAWFVQNVYPRVAEALPTSFDVVGEPPRRPRQAPGITYHGRVASVLPFYEQADAVVVPVFEGSGTRLKVVEAMALGRPVVSTRLGAEGLGLQPREHYVAAEDPDEFSAALIELARALEGEGVLIPMLARARAAAEPLFWDVIVDELTATYRSLLPDRAGHEAVAVL